MPRLLNHNKESLVSHFSFNLRFAISHCLPHTMKILLITTNNTQLKQTLLLRSHSYQAHMKSVDRQLCPSTSVLMQDDGEGGRNPGRTAAAAAPRRISTTPAMETWSKQTAGPAWSKHYKVHVHVPAGAPSMLQLRSTSSCVQVALVVVVWVWVAVGNKCGAGGATYMFHVQQPMLICPMEAM